MGKDNKEIIKLVSTYHEILDSGQGLLNKIKLYFVYRKINRTIDKIARIQAELFYKQTVNLYKDIVKSNIK